jgi:hypothetical protein
MQVDLDALEAMLSGPHDHQEALHQLAYVRRNGLAYRKFPSIRREIADMMPDTGAVAMSRLVR